MRAGIASILLGRTQQRGYSTGRFPCGHSLEDLCKALAVRLQRPALHPRPKPYSGCLRTGQAGLAGRDTSGAQVPRDYSCLSSLSPGQASTRLPSLDPDQCVCMQRRAPPPPGRQPYLLIAPDSVMEERVNPEGKTVPLAQPTSQLALCLQPDWPAWKEAQHAVLLPQYNLCPCYTAVPHPTRFLRVHHAPHPTKD